MQASKEYKPRMSQEQALVIYRSLDLAEVRKEFETYCVFVRRPIYTLSKDRNGHYDYGDTEEAFNGFLAAKIAECAK